MTMSARLASLSGVSLVFSPRNKAVAAVIFKKEFKPLAELAGPADDADRWFICGHIE